MTKLEKQIGAKIEVMQYGAQCMVVLHSGHQQFRVGHDWDTKREAQWMRRMLRKALVNLVNEVKP
jgi:hypothetical protein